MSDPIEIEIRPGAPGAWNRRRFLAGVGVAGVAVALAACGGDDDDDSSGGSSTTTEGGGGSTTTAGGATTTTEGGADGAAVDTEIAMLAAGLEVLAVQTYQAAAAAATAGDLGEVPPAVVEFVTTALSQHEEHLGAWNDVLTGGGNDEVTEPDATLKPTVDDAFGQVSDVTGAAELALMLEQTAAATYLDAVGRLTNPDARELAGSLQIIDMQHSALLLFVLGRYPVPEVFATTNMSAAS